VEGGVEISAATATLKMFETDSTDLNTYLRTGNGEFRINTANDAGAGIAERFTIDHSTGDISFYEDTGTTPKFFWDASEESLGIGTSSPEGDGLHVQASDNNNDDDLISLGFTFDANSKVLGTIGVHNSASNTGGLKFSTKNAGTLAERMRIDASGNLLVGKTTGALNTAGLELANTGYISASIDGDVAGYFNRKTSDGDIVQFYKDGATVGSIGTNSSRLTIGNGDTGLLIAGDLDNITPFNTSTNASRDAAVDLGNSGVRFKDLYLSGGVYLGGTGSANKLDDYEEGTWTPVLSGATTTTYTEQTGTYTKVGRLVFIYCELKINSIGDGSPQIISGLPFSAGEESTLNVSKMQSASASFYSIQVRTSGINIYASLQNNLDGNITTNPNYITSGTQMQFSGVYYTT
jgi:hypothetical protein